MYGLPIEDFVETITVVLGGISENMASLEQTAMYSAINTIDPTTMGYYVVKLIYNTLKLQEDTNRDKQWIKSGEVEVITKYLIIMKEKNNYYWKQENHQNILTVSTHIIVNNFNNFSHYGGLKYNK